MLLFMLFISPYCFCLFNEQSATILIQPFIIFMHFLFPVKSIWMFFFLSLHRLIRELCSGLTCLFWSFSVSVQEMTSPSWWSLRSWMSVTTTCPTRSSAFLQRRGVKRPPTPPPRLLPHLPHLHPHRPLLPPRRPVMQWVYTVFGGGGVVTFYRATDQAVFCLVASRIRTERRAGR